MKKNYSIRLAILKRCISGVFFVVFMAIVSIDVLISNWMNHEFDEQLESKASLLITITKFLDEGIDFDFADEFMPEFLSVSSQQANSIADNEDDAQYMPIHLEGVITQEYFEVRFADGDILETSYSLADDHLPIIETDQDIAFKSIRLGKNKNIRMVQSKFKPQIPEDERRTLENISAVPNMVMSVAMSTADNDRIKWLMHISLLLLTLITLYLIYNIIDRSIKKGFAPLQQLKSELNQLSVENLDERIHSGENVIEISSVVEQINNLLTRLDSSIQREKRFSSNVSHELRTPVSEIRALADVAYKWPEDKELTEKSLLEIREASVHMEDLIDKLLQLAKAESFDLSLVYDPISIEDCIHPILNTYSETITSRSLSISQSYVNGQQCKTSVEHLNIILSNLLCNAIKYANEGSTIDISTRIQDKNSLLTISNQVDNFTQADVVSMFDRFWMKDQVRSNFQSSGIGLSLCKALCNSLGYQLDAQLNDRTTPMRLSMTLLITNCKDT